MKISFFGAAHEVTGSCTILEVCGKRIMVDCGMEQGTDLYENREIPFAPGQIDYLLLTHAHIDHSGRIPALVAGGFSGPVYTTLATEKLCSIMLLDSAHIQEFEAQWRNRKAKRAGVEPYVPLYTTEDVRAAMKLFRPCSYDTEYELFDGVKIKFTDAGHLLGSASISVTVTEDGESRTIVFSGDIGNINRPLINDPGQPAYADIAVIESTYGNRLHGERPDYVSQLARIIQETLDRGGNVVIPCFAVGRTQEMLYLLRTVKEKGLVTGHDHFPVFVDSPLAVEATEIYSNSLREFYDPETLALLDNGINPIKFPDLRVSVTSDESVAINMDKTPKIILSASGMCEAGRIRHHLKHNLWRQESTVLFVGYQSEGTLGRSIIEGSPTVKLFSEEIQVNAHIEQMEGISGHADQKILLRWLDGFTKKPETVFVNHGDDTVCEEFAETITREFGIRATAPYNGAAYDLVTGECLEKGNTVRIVKKTRGGFRESTAFGRLLRAGQRLMAIIQRYRECANKDIAKFTDQIIALCNKWDK